MAIKRFILFGALSIAINYAYSQADVANILTGHVGLNPAWYVGWNATTPFPLNVQHLGNERINFSTNGFNRMFIDNGLGLGFAP